MNNVVFLNYIVFAKNYVNSSLIYFVVALLEDFYCDVVVFLF